MTDTTFVKIQIKQDYLNDSHVNASIKQDGILLYVRQGGSKADNFGGIRSLCTNDDSASITLPPEVARDLGQKLISAAARHGDILAEIKRGEEEAERAQKATQERIRGIFG